MNGRQVRLYLADGTSGGLLTAEIMNWTGHVVAAPRSDLATLLKRPEVSRTGVYLLLGDDPERPGNGQAYIGEGDDVGKRLYQHRRDEAKDFWDRAVVLTSKDMNLTKAHARYLESRFIELATEAGRAKLTNATAPPSINLPVLDINVLRSTSVETSSPSRVPRRVRRCSSWRRPGTVSVAVPRRSTASSPCVPGRRHAASGSVKAPKAMPRCGLGSRPMGHWSRAMMTGRWCFRGIRFCQSERVGRMLLGRPSNGRMEWRVEATGASYGDWQAALLEGMDP